MYVLVYLKLPSATIVSATTKMFFSNLVSQKDLFATWSMIYNVQMVNIPCPSHPESTYTDSRHTQGSSCKHLLRSHDLAGIGRVRLAQFCIVLVPCCIPYDPRSKRIESIVCPPWPLHNLNIKFKSSWLRGGIFKPLPHDTCRRYRTQYMGLLPGLTWHHWPLRLDTPWQQLLLCK